MMYLYGLKDIAANAFIQIIPHKELAVLKRSLKNAVNTPSKDVCYTNPEDFQLFQLGTLDERTGIVTSDIKLEFNLTELKNNAS